MSRKYRETEQTKRTRIYQGQLIEGIHERVIDKSKSKGIIYINVYRGLAKDYDKLAFQRLHYRKVKDNIADCMQLAINELEAARDILKNYPL